MVTARTMPVTVPPLRVESAYADRDAVWRTLLDHAPHPMMAAGAGYSEMMGSVPLEPWFRSSWAADGKSADALPRLCSRMIASSTLQGNYSARKSLGRSR